MFPACAPGFLRLFWLVALGAMALLLVACAGVIRLENDVRSYPQWGAPERPAAGDLFQFQRLPSQATAKTGQTELEALTQARLQALGLQRASDGGPAPRWLVEVSARSQQWPHAPWEDPRERWPGMGLVGRDAALAGSGQFLWMPGFARLTPPYYLREVTVVVRQAGHGQAVFESRAAHDGPWPDSPALWGALVQAALDGFPQPPSGPRRVVIEVPR